MILFINASGKAKNSNSKYFSDLLNIDNCIYSYLYKDKFDKIIYNINKCNTIVFLYPTYVDTVPAKLLEFIEYYNGDFKNKDIYLMVNCGFLENYHNDLSIEYMENYIKEKKGNFKGYYNIGSGEIIKICKKYNYFKPLVSNFFIKLHLFKKKVLNKEDVRLKTNMNFLSKRNFCKMANFFWKKKMRF